MHYCSVVVYVCTTSHPWPNYYVSFRWKMTKWTKISFRCYSSRQARGQLHLFLEKIFLCSCDSDLTKVRPNTEHIHCKLVWLVKTKHTSTIELWKNLREVSQFLEKALSRAFSSCNTDSLGLILGVEVFFFWGSLFRSTVSGIVPE